MTPFRVVFDTNAFTPEKFDLLEKGPLIRLCNSGRIVPIYGNVFLEETFRAYGSEGKRQALVDRWIPFILSTVNRFCDDFLGIWHRELVQGQGPKTNIFMSPVDQSRLIERLPAIPLDGSWRAWHASKYARDIENEKRLAQRETSKAIRQEVADWRKMIRYDPKTHGISRLDRYFENEVENAGRDFLVALVKCKDPNAVASRWARSKGQYPYFTTFVINMLYIAHHAMTKVNSRIDLNAQADLDVMTHLLRADALVTNEGGFMSQAFDDLWRPKGKVKFTSEQFANLVQSF